MHGNIGVVSLDVDKELKSIQHVHKNLWQRKELTGSKAKQHATKDKRQTGRGIGKHKEKTLRAKGQEKNR